MNEIKAKEETITPEESTYAYPETIFSKMQFRKYKPLKAKKYTVTEADEQELIEVMENIGYSWSEISDKVNRKYKKYGIVNRRTKEEKPQSENEIKRKQNRDMINKRNAEVKKKMIKRWKKAKSLPFKQNTQNMFNWMLKPVNNKELELDSKKQIRTHFNQGFTDWLTKKWKYNDRMGDRMWKYGFDKKCIVNTLTQLSVHHDQYDIESPYEITGFIDLDWKIIVPKVNKEARNISLHNFTIFKDQIMINQHNRLYNSKIERKHIPSLQAKRNEKVLQELSFDLQT
jgi:arsenate reductase-like glutaredoxin family protein